jgi:hypothetical protein
MDNLKEHAEEFCERIEFLLCPLGMNNQGSIFSESKVEYYLNICCKLRDTGKLDSSQCHTMDLFHFTNSMIQLAKAIEFDPCLGWYEWKSNGDVSGLLELLYLGLGYALIYEDDASEFDNSSDFLHSDSTTAMAAVARMKVSSFRSAISASNITLSSIKTDQSDDEVIAFVKSRRGFKPLDIYDGDATQDNYKIEYLGNNVTAKFLARTLIGRAKGRNITTEQLCYSVGLCSKNELAKKIVLPENATSIAKLLSLDIHAYMFCLEQIELEREKVIIAKKYKQLLDIPPNIVVSDIKSDSDLITPDEFIELVKTVGSIHPLYTINKKLVGMKLNTGQELGVDISTSKSLTFWLNAINKDSVLEPFIKAEYAFISEQTSKYGRHSALRKYSQLAYEPVIKLSLKTVGDARKILNHLKLFS